MKRIITFLVCILIGVGIGWYFGFSRPVAKNQRELLKEYHYTLDHLHMTDAEMTEFGKHYKEYFEAMKRQDEYAAAVALLVYKRLGAGNVEGAKWELATTISTYYRGHRLDGNTNLLTRITSYAATNSAMSNAIYGKLE
jgi:hypothetical protein